ncbi:hypothetical protein PEX2_031590 [Penicillium expansum]|uniref:Uncharacterized protein n=1 Tax=Penicillium expansum TaxID=27334 RepID=A0A0A2J1Q8_PENEN|nr:hypothetical protein PEX2_031590 [Penicillium expansum]KGO49249.1 hypothetical protein PEXP_009160 [Penicillium expansum]KGO49526.1 hypothetical protein PEX2_031590 [Penicillium expansum]
MHEMIGNNVSNVESTMIQVDHGPWAQCVVLDGPFGRLWLRKLSLEWERRPLHLVWEWIIWTDPGGIPSPPSSWSPAAPSPLPVPSNLHPTDKFRTPKMSALSVHFNTISETPMLTTMSRHSDMSDDADSPDVKCFQELPDDTYEAIGSEARAIRKIIREQQNLPIKVMKYPCFINVPPNIVEEVSLSSARHMFSYDTRSMIIKLVTGAHDAASRGLLCEVRDVVHDMGLHRSIHPVGSKRVRGVSSSKEADESWVPTQHVPGRDAKWPTVVVEVGVSESYRKLKADAEWWLTNSKGDVNLVIIVSINRTTPNIKFEAVSLDISSLRHQRPRYVPTIRQSITTSRRGAQTTTSPAVALTIEFEELCCCQPVPREHDIEISPDQLADISSEVWMEQSL